MCLTQFFHDLKRVARNLQLEKDLISSCCRVGARSGDYRLQPKHDSAEGAVGLVYDKQVI